MRSVPWRVLVPRIGSVVGDILASHGDPIANHANRADVSLGHQASPLDGIGTSLQVERALFQEFRKVGAEDC